MCGIAATVARAVQQPTPEQSRAARESEATFKANEQFLNDRRRQRQQAGTMSTGKDYGGSVLASAKPAGAASE